MIIVFVVEFLFFSPSTTQPHDQALQEADCPHGKWPSIVKTERHDF